MHPHSLLFFRGGPVLVHIQNGLWTCPIYIVLVAGKALEPGSVSNIKVSETNHWASFLKITAIFKTLAFAS